MLSVLSFILLNGYILWAILLLGGLWLLPRHRESIVRWLACANALLLLGATLFLLLMAWGLFQLLPFRSEWDYYAFSNRIAGPYGFVVWAAFAGQGLLPQAFWRARRRRSPTFTAVAAAGLLATFYVPLLPTQDYLPSSWGMQPNYQGLLLATGIFLGLLVLLRLVSGRLQPRFGFLP